jgi:hypothetical protein
MTLPMTVLGVELGVELMAAIPELPKETFDPEFEVVPLSIRFCKFDLKLAKLMETVLEKL